MAGWGLLLGDFFDLYDVVEVLEIPSGLAGQLMIYLRSMHSVELLAEVRVGLKEPRRAKKGFSSRCSVFTKSRLRG
ncbi:hypothetical protein D3C80_1527000 [compost metagenome]